VAFLEVTVYVVVEEGDATTEAPVVADRPVAGLHEYVLPPDAVNVVELPLQMVAEAGVITKLGPDTVVKVTLAVAAHPVASTPVTT
jgi:hypothetical protein